MPVASSTHAVGHPQADGRRYVREIHTLTAGSPIVAEYLAGAELVEADYLAIRTARVARINEQLAAAEYESLLDRGWGLEHQTAAELAARFRAEYLTADRDRVCRMAYWLLERIAAGDFTDVQCRNAFGLTTQQWNNLKSTRLQPQHDAWAAVLAATGA
jgi:hypothetical protein